MVPENIYQQREEVIQNNNTAQARLGEIIESANKTNKSLRIAEQLHGDIDLSILREKGAGNIRDIEFAEGGEITAIIGIPKSIERISCPRNLLIAIENLPETLLQLEVEGNYLTEINVSSLPDLQVLKISNNYIRHLSDLPASLLEIECNDNKLTDLDLRGLEDLNRLIISNNMITVIENLPENIVDFQFDNNPTIEFRNSPSIMDDEDDNQTKEKKKKENPVKKVAGYTPTEALQEYFRLKNKYEQSIKKGKKRIAEKVVSRSELTVQARARIVKRAQQMYKPSCIKCGRPVGTIFTKKNHRFSAICGDVGNACPLNIQIYVGDYTPVPYLLYDLRNEYENLKEKLIRQKLDTLFRYISEAESVAIYKEEIDGFTTYKEMLDDLVNRNDELYHNEEREHQIVEKEGAIFRLIERIRTLLEDYKQDGNPKILETVLRIQRDDLYPEIQNLRLLKHEVMEMEGDVKNPHNPSHLVKMPVGLTKMEHTFGEPSRVISFVK
jgi:hypothetical protein